MVTPGGRRNGSAKSQPFDRTASDVIPTAYGLPYFQEADLAAESNSVVSV
jgi:hypothetical protein